MDVPVIKCHTTVIDANVPLFFCQKNKSSCTRSLIETFPRGKQLVQRLDFMKNRMKDFKTIIATDVIFKDYIHEYRDVRKSNITMASVPLGRFSFLVPYTTIGLGYSGDLTKTS